MEEEYDTPDPDFVKGFNEGYTLAQHLPDLAEQLGKATGDSQRSTGFQAGRQQLILEQSQERYPAWLRGDYTGRSLSDTTPDKDLEPDR